MSPRSWSDRLAVVFEDTFQASFAHRRTRGMDPAQAWDKAIEDAQTITSTLLRDAAKQGVFRTGLSVDETWSDREWVLDPPTDEGEKP